MKTVRFTRYISKTETIELPVPDAMLHPDADLFEYLEVLEVFMDEQGQSLDWMQVDYSVDGLDSEIVD
jgi:hypothetical protein